MPARRTGETMSNLTEITNMTNRALDAFLLARANPSEAVCCANLTEKERLQVAIAMGWDLSKFGAWISATSDRCDGDCGSIHP